MEKINGIMSRCLKAAVLSGVLFVSAMPVFAQSLWLGQDGISASGLGMGGARMALTDDLDMLVLNPSRLNSVVHTNVQVSYTNYFGLTNVQFAGVSGKILNFPVAAGYLFLGNTTFESTDEAKNSLDTSVAYSSTMLSAATGMTVSGIPLGATVHWIRKSVGSDAIQGMTCDFSGAMSFSEAMGMAVTVKNILPVKMGPDQLERQLILGAFARILPKTLTLEGDWVLGTADSARLNVGIEYVIIPELVVRGGLKDVLSLEALSSKTPGIRPVMTFGTSVSLLGMRMDLAYLDHELAPIYRFSVLMDL